MCLKQKQTFTYPVNYLGNLWVNVDFLSNTVFAYFQILSLNFFSKVFLLHGEPNDTFKTFQMFFFHMTFGLKGSMQCFGPVEGVYLIGFSICFLPGIWAKTQSNIFKCGGQGSSLKLIKSSNHSKFKIFHESVYEKRVESCVTVCDIHTVCGIQLLHLDQLISNANEMGMNFACLLK